jgi:hypothetical protein
MDREDKKQLERERTSRRRPARPAGGGRLNGQEKEPEQDETASTFWDTDQHSDAPGLFGTG